MSRVAPAVRSSIHGLVTGGIDGHIQAGDMLEFWVFDDENYRHRFAPIQWVPELNQAIGVHVADFVQKLRFERVGHMEKAVSDLQQTITDQSSVTALIITDGEDLIHGTPFDALINRDIVRRSRALSREKRPFIVLLEGRNGTWLASSVQAAGEPILYAKAASELANLRPSPAPPPAIPDAHPAPVPVPPQTPPSLPQPAPTVASETSGPPPTPPPQPAPIVAQPMPVVTKSAEVPVIPGQPEVTNPAPAPAPPPQPSTTVKLSPVQQQTPVAVEEIKPEAQVAVAKEQPIPTPTPTQLPEPGTRPATPEPMVMPIAKPVPPALTVQTQPPIKSPPVSAPTAIIKETPPVAESTKTASPTPDPITSPARSKPPEGQIPTPQVAVPEKSVTLEPTVDQRSSVPSNIIPALPTQAAPPIVTPKPAGQNPSVAMQDLPMSRGGPGNRWVYLGIAAGSVSLAGVLLYALARRRHTRPRVSLVSQAMEPGPTPPRRPRQ